MERIIRVAYLCEFPTVLGGESSLLAFLQQRAFAGVDPLVICPQTGMLTDMLERMYIPREPWPAGGKRNAIELAGTLEEWGIDLIHANSLMTCTQALDLADAMSIPCVGHIRDIMTISADQRDRLNRMDAMIAVSDYVREWMLGQGIASQKLHRIYNGIDFGVAKRSARSDELRRRLSIANNVRLVGCVGQICLRKGQDLFLEAARIVAASVANAEFVVLGARYSQKAETVEFESRLREIADSRPLQGRVHFPGYLENGSEWIADLDLLVSASRQEPLSRTILEALAVGTPVIATNVGGSREILQHSKKEFDVQLQRCDVPKDDPAALAEAITHELNRANLRNQWQDIYSDIVQTRFSIEKNVRAVREIYDDVLSR